MNFDIKSSLPFQGFKINKQTNKKFRSKVKRTLSIDPDVTKQLN